MDFAVPSSLPGCISCFTAAEMASLQRMHKAGFSAGILLQCAMSVFGCARSSQESSGRCMRGCTRARKGGNRVTECAHLVLPVYTHFLHDFCP